MALRRPKDEKSGQVVDSYQGYFQSESFRSLPLIYNIWSKRAEGLLNKGYASEFLVNTFALDAYLWAEYRSRLSYRIIKRTFDLFVASITCVAVFPIFLLFALLIKLESPGPVIFRQTRVGKRGKIFLILKFRTMRENTEGTDQHLKLFPLQKDFSRHRVTRVGRYMRKWKIDELPQLFNVIKGEMSLVGPRPLPVEEAATCPSKYIDRLAVKPGLTGLWQAYFPNVIEGKYKLKLDSIYARRSTFFFDIFLCFRTIPMVLRGEEPLKSKRQKL